MVFPPTLFKTGEWSVKGTIQRAALTTKRKAANGPIIVSTPIVQGNTALSAASVAMDVDINYY